MRNGFIAACILLSISSVYAVGLLPGANIYYVRYKSNVDSDTFPQFSGTIVDLSQSSSLVAENNIKVPNNFPKSIGVGEEGNYFVSPQPPISGLIQWTYPIKYSHSDGSGCYLQFAWDPVTKAPAIGIEGTNGQQGCGFQSGSGTNININ